MQFLEPRCHPTQAATVYTCISKFYFKAAISVAAMRPKNQLWLRALIERRLKTFGLWSFMQNTAKNFLSLHHTLQSSWGLLLSNYPIFFWFLQCVTIENRQGPIYDMKWGHFDRVNSTFKMLLSSWNFDTVFKKIRSFDAENLGSVG